MNKPNKTPEKNKQNNLYYKQANRHGKPGFFVSFLKSIWGHFSDLHLKSHTKRELNALVLVLFSGIIILSLINTAGLVGSWLKDIITQTFGYGSFLLPLFMIGIAVRLFLIQDKKENEGTDDEKRKKDYSIFRLYLGSFLFISFVLGLFHISVPYEELKSTADNGQFGGYIGFTVNFFLRPLFGKSGSMFVMVFLVIISLQLALEISWKTVFSYFYEFFTSRNVHRVTSKPKIEQIFIREKEIEKEKPKTEEKPKEKTADFTVQSLSKEKSDYKLPALDLLDFEPFSVHVDLEEIIENKKIIKKTFSDFNINISIGNEDFSSGDLLFKNKEQILQGVAIGPTVTQYAFKPEAGVKLTRLTALQNDLALALAARSLRIEAPIPGKALVGLEIPNDKRSMVKLRSIFESESFKAMKSNLRLILGRDVSGEAIVADLAKMPHLLVAGATGSGKSVCINSFIISLLYQNSPDTLKFIMVDPKRVELSIYNGIPHLLAPVIVDPQKTVAALRWAVAEMDRRYRLLSEAGFKNISDFNNGSKKEDNLPFIIVLIDELADLMMVASKEVEGLICRLAQMARAIGIHLIVATQRPSVDVITGLIKANIPARIAFTVSSSIDSRTIIDSIGAERLLGSGDMLYLPSDDNKPHRIQGIYLTPHEIRKVTNFVRSIGEPDYDQMITERPDAKKIYSDDEESDDLEDNDKQNRKQELGFNISPNQRIPGVDDFNTKNDDELMIEAMRVMIETKKASASFLQRRLRLGYARASRMIDLLEDRGFIGPQDGIKPREILISKESLEKLYRERSS